MTKHILDNSDWRSQREKIPEHRIRDTHIPRRYVPHQVRAYDVSGILWVRFWKIYYSNGERTDAFLKRMRKLEGADCLPYIVLRIDSNWDTGTRDLRRPLPAPGTYDTESISISLVETLERRIKKLGEARQARAKEVLEKAHNATDPRRWYVYEHDLLANLALHVLVVGRPQPGIEQYFKSDSRQAQALAAAFSEPSSTVN